MSPEQTTYGTKTFSFYMFSSSATTILTKATNLPTLRPRDDDTSGEGATRTRPVCFVRSSREFSGGLCCVARGGGFFVLATGLTFLCNWKGEKQLYSSSVVSFSWS